MPEFKPLNLAQVYQSADAAVANALQTNLLVMQAQKMKQEFDEESQLRELARSSLSTDASGAPSFDLKGFTKGAYAINPMKGLAFEKTQREAEKAGLERENLQGQIDERRMKQAADRLKHMNEASTVPYLKWKELVDKGVPDAEARAQVQPLYQQAVQNLSASGMFTRDQMAKFDLTPEFDPAKAEVGMRQVLGAKEQLAQYWNERNFSQRERHHQDSMEIQVQGQRITIRGQNLTDARARQQIALAELDVDRDRGVVTNKRTGQTFKIVGPDGGALPPKSGDVEGLRKEFNAREEVKNYNAAVPVLRSIAQAPNTTAGDLDFIYGVGKILDPGSVVREGEMALVIKSGSPMERILGTTQWVAGEGKLTPKIRAQLIEVLNQRVTELKTAADDARKPFEVQARRQNIPINETLTLPELPKIDRRGRKIRTGAEIPSFATEADAQAAAKAGRIKPGDRIKIGNQTGVWE
jgi:hypothetical protein